MLPPIEDKIFFPLGQIRKEVRIFPVFLGDRRQEAFLGVGVGSIVVKAIVIHDKFIIVLTMIKYGQMVKISTVSKY